MRILSVVQRYGEDIGGGAESSCRSLAHALVGRGHQVEVLTSCARSYADWANHYAAGRSDDDGAIVHRLEVAQPLDRRTFDPLDRRVIGALSLGGPLPLFAQQEWLRALGPTMPDLRRWIDTNVDRFDVVTVHTLTYAHAPMTIDAVARRVPVVLHPLAHDDHLFGLAVFDDALASVDACAFLTPEEEALVLSRAADRSGAVIGLGIDPAPRELPSTEAVRDRLGLDSGEPFLVCVGRVDREKGVHGLVDAIRTARRRGLALPTLVLIGEPVHPIMSDAAVRSVGRLDRAAVAGAMRDVLALVHPSASESFAIVLGEAWMQGTPALVNAACAVTVAQCRRSGGGLAWRDVADLAAQVDALVAEPALREAIGERGRQYALEHMGWTGALDRYEALLASVVRAAP